MKNIKNIIVSKFKGAVSKFLGLSVNTKRVILGVGAIVLILIVAATSVGLMRSSSGKDSSQAVADADYSEGDLVNAKDSETPEEKTATEKDRENTEPEEEVNGAVEDIKTQPTIDTPEGVVQDQSSVPKTQGGISGSGGETTTTKPSTGKSTSTGSGSTSSSSGSGSTSSSSGSTTTTKPSTTPTRESASSVEARLRKDTYRTGQNNADMSKIGTGCSCTPAFLSNSMPIINSFIAGSISADSARAQLQALDMTGEYDGVEGYGTQVTRIYSITIVDVTSKGSDGFSGAANAAYKLAGTGVQNLSVTYDSSSDTYRTKGILVETCPVRKQN